MKRNKSFLVFGISLLVWCFSVLFALSVGAVSDAGMEVIYQIRLPRVILASAIGMGLSVAGAALQALFSNPLCEPYTLGIASGSALGALMGISFGVPWMMAGLTGSAFLGAILFSGVLYLFSYRTHARSISLLLAGVMLSFLGTSLVTLWISLFDTDGIHRAVLWLFGDLSRARLQGAIFSAAGVMALTLILWQNWKNLDGLLMGEEGAVALGVDVKQSQRRMIVLTSLIIALCVSAGGMIGFVGLVIPHLARRWVGSLHLRLIPLCAILGAAGLTFADCLSRWLARPYELPVGVVTSLIGAPLFLWVMLKRQEVI
jgi:iron complex transport system permease protein